MCMGVHVHTHTCTHTHTHTHTHTLIYTHYSTTYNSHTWCLGITLKVLTTELIVANGMTSVVITCTYINTHSSTNQHNLVPYICSFIPLVIIIVSFVEIQFYKKQTLNSYEYYLNFSTII